MGVGMTDRDPDHFRDLLAFLLVGAFIVCIPLMIFKTLPEPNKEIITYMVGQLSGMALTALGFYFVNKVGQDKADAKRAELDAQRADTTKAAFEAVTAAATAGVAQEPEPDVVLKPGEAARAEDAAN